jgi:hypothetical protein
MSRSVQSAAIKRNSAAFSNVAWTRWSVGVLLLVFLVSLQLAPSVIEQRRDSGIFAYTGMVIANGGLPYQDAWDNKLPGVYLIDAFAFIIFGTNRWALWLIENFALALAGLVIFRLLAQVYRDRTEAWGGTLIVILLARHPGLVSDVNFTEPYALLPQAIVYYQGYHFLRQPSYRRAFIIGFAAGAAFLIKQTTIGVALAFLPAVWMCQHPVLHIRRVWRQVGVIILGGLSILSLMSFYLLLNGILDDALKASFVAARDFHAWVGKESVWVGQALFSSLTSAGFVSVFLPLAPFLLIGMAVAVRRVREMRASQTWISLARRTEVTLACWAALAFWIDLILANVTGRSYEHYFVPLIPSVAMLVLLALPEIQKYGRRHTGKRRLLASGARAYLVVLLAGVPVGTSIARFWMADWDIAGPERRAELALYVMRHTDMDEKVLVWGADTAINFQSERESPTQYTYGYPLIVPEATTDEAIQEMVLDLETQRPALIIDTTLRDGERIPPLDEMRRISWWAAGGRRDVANLDPIYQFVEDHCQVINEVELATIYHCRYHLAGDGALSFLFEPLAQGTSAFSSNLGVNWRSDFEALLAEVSHGVY